MTKFSFFPLFSFLFFLKHKMTIQTRSSVNPPDQDQASDEQPGTPPRNRASRRAAQKKEVKEAKITKTTRTTRTTKTTKTAKSSSSTTTILNPKTTHYE
jgi:hypothetical protein